MIRSGLPVEPTEYPIPYGASPIRLTENTKGLKRVFSLELHPSQIPFKIEITNRISFDTVLSELYHTSLIKIDSEEYEPGFYRMFVLCENRDTYHLTFMNLFSCYVKFGPVGEYILEKTIW